MPLVTEDWGQYEFSRGVRGRRHFIITGVANALEAETALAGQMGVARNASHDLDNTLLARQPVISHPKGPNYWEADVEWLPPDISDGSSGGGLPVDGTVRWSRRSAPRDESTDVDAHDDPLPILNTAGQPFQSDHTATFNGHLLTARRMENAFRGGIAEDFENTVNKNTVVIPRFGTFAPGRLLLRSYESEDEVTGTGTEPLMCVYVFEARRGFKQDPDGLWDGFKHRMRNEGFMGWFKGEKQPELGNFITSKNNRVSEPVLLDKTGKPIDTSIMIENESGGEPLTPVAAPNTFSDSLIETTGAGVVFLKYYKFRAVHFGPLALF